MCSPFYLDRYSGTWALWRWRILKMSNQDTLLHLWVCFCYSSWFCEQLNAHFLFRLSLNSSNVKSCSFLIGERSNVFLSLSFDFSELQPQSLFWGFQTYKNFHLPWWWRFNENYCYNNQVERGNGEGFSCSVLSDKCIFIVLLWFWFDYIPSV